MYHLVNLTPIGQSANVAVVNEKICLYLAGEMVVIFDLLFRIIFVNGVKLDTALTTPVYGVLKELSFSYAPKNELVVFFNEHLLFPLESKNAAIEAHIPIPIVITLLLI